MLKDKSMGELKMCANVKNQNGGEAKAGMISDVLSDCYAKGTINIGLILF